MRLDLLTRVADAVERSRGTYMFDICGWGSGDCGCAIGIAIATGEFKNEGLAARQIDSWGELNYRPIYNENKDWLAVQDFFEMTEEQVTSLFHTRGYHRNGGYYYPTAADVIAKIRQFVADHTPKPVSVKKQKVLELA